MEAMVTGDLTAARFNTGASMILRRSSAVAVAPLGAGTAPRAAPAIANAAEVLKKCRRDTTPADRGVFMTR